MKADILVQNDGNQSCQRIRIDIKEAELLALPLVREYLITLLHKV